MDVIGIAPRFVRASAGVERSAACKPVGLLARSSRPQSVCKPRTVHCSATGGGNFGSFGGSGSRGGGGGG
eukprot:CAMPEP_0198210942 /NCGR_PEP_ID=MMETSP1445-20131203/22533_1 /TAXON_ID=36898 /ORGANISM="Pyramimonas sp., Strain CCMP2087" /LENGTH=69 /DNA_ID=CAMNT_0043885111 /DNA_START=61 /DNA_END=267 /DNA_ORIENTATION=+